MSYRLIACVLCAGLLWCGDAATVTAQEMKAIVLPQPQVEGGKPLMQVFKERRSQREFSSQEIPLQVLSNLLWAACGINRPETGMRTAPSTRNMQEIDVYVVMAGGVYLYDAKGHSLKPFLGQDIRGITGRQAFVKEAPINLVFVANFALMNNAAAEDAILYSAADTGFISENVYLYCASAGLSTVVRAWVDKAALSKAMKLRPDQKIMLCQTVGYPRK
ncbi:MAG: SagB/ThcOx family dehydrogenase [Candidatus Omnitrophica bacterium]|nr:SagB/ThcOx family dehydrogenase [Candidatus Omnitrophota bacterium]